MKRRRWRVALDPYDPTVDCRRAPEVDGLGTRNVRRVEGEASPATPASLTRVAWGAHEEDCASGGMFIEEAPETKLLRWTLVKQGRSLADLHCRVRGIRHDATLGHKYLERAWASALLDGLQKSLAHREIHDEFFPPKAAHEAPRRHEVVIAGIGNDDVHLSQARVSVDCSQL